MKQDILNFINQVLSEENGSPVTAESTLSDSALDSMGYLFFIMSLEKEYNIVLPGALDQFPSMPVKQLINLCRDEINNNN